MSSLSDSDTSSQVPAGSATPRKRRHTKSRVRAAAAELKKLEPPMTPEERLQRDVAIVPVEGGKLPFNIQYNPDPTRIPYVKPPLPPGVRRRRPDDPEMPEWVYKVPTQYCRLKLQLRASRLIPQGRLVYSYAIVIVNGRKIAQTPIALAPSPHYATTVIMDVPYARRGAGKIEDDFHVIPPEPEALREGETDPREVEGALKFFGGWHRHASWLETLPIQSTLGVVIMGSLDGQEIPWAFASLPIEFLVYAAHNPAASPYRLTLTQPLRPAQTELLVKNAATIDVFASMTPLPDAAAATLQISVPRTSDIAPQVMALLPGLRGVLVPATVAAEQADHEAMDADASMRTARLEGLREQLRAEMDALAASEGVELLAVVSLPDAEGGFQRARRGAWSHATKGFAGIDESTQTAGAAHVAGGGTSAPGTPARSGGSGSTGWRDESVRLHGPPSPSPSVAGSLAGSLTGSLADSAVSSAVPARLPRRPVSLPVGTLPPAPPPFTEEELATMFSTLEPPPPRAGPGASVAAALLAAESAGHELIDARSRIHRWCAAGALVAGQEAAERVIDGSRATFIEIFGLIRRLQRRRALARAGVGHESADDPRYERDAEILGAQLQELLLKHAAHNAENDTLDSPYVLSQPQQQQRLPATPSTASAAAAAGGDDDAELHTPVGKGRRSSLTESTSSSLAGALSVSTSQASLASSAAGSVTPSSAARARIWALSPAPPTPTPASRRRHHITVAPNAAPLDQRLFWLRRRVLNARAAATKALTELRANLSEAVRGVPPVGRRAIAGRAHFRNMTPSELSEEARFDRRAAELPPTVASGVVTRGPGELLRRPMLQAAVLRGLAPGDDAAGGTESMAKEKDQLYAEQRWRRDHGVVQSEAEAATEAAEQARRAKERLMPPLPLGLAAAGAAVYYSSAEPEVGIVSFPGKSMFMECKDIATGDTVPMRVTTVPPFPATVQPSRVLMWPPIPKSLLAIAPLAFSVQRPDLPFHGVKALSSAPFRATDHETDALQAAARAAARERGGPVPVATEAFKAVAAAVKSHRMIEIPNPEAAAAEAHVASASAAPSPRSSQAPSPARHGARSASASPTASPQRAALAQSQPGIVSPSSSGSASSAASPSSSSSSSSRRPRAQRNLSRSSASYQSTPVRTTLETITEEMGPLTPAGAVIAPWSRAHEYATNRRAGLSAELGDSSPAILPPPPAGQPAAQAADVAATAAAADMVSPKPQPQQLTLSALPASSSGSSDETVIGAGDRSAKRSRGVPKRRPDAAGASSPPTGSPAPSPSPEANSTALKASPVFGSVELDASPFSQRPLSAQRLSPALEPISAAAAAAAEAAAAVEPADAAAQQQPRTPVKWFGSLLTTPGSSARRKAGNRPSAVSALFGFPISVVAAAPAAPSPRSDTNDADDSSGLLGSLELRFNQ